MYLSYIVPGYYTAAVSSSTAIDSHVSNRDTVLQAQRACGILREHGLRMRIIAGLFV